MAKARMRGFNFRCTYDPFYIRQEFAFLRALQYELATQLRMFETGYDALHFIGTIANSMFSSDKSGIMQASAALRSRFEKMVKALAPWIKFSDVRTLTNEQATEMKKSWEQAFGKLDSPEIAGEINRMLQQDAEDAKRPKSQVWRTEEGFEII